MSDMCLDLHLNVYEAYYMAVIVSLQVVCVHQVHRCVCNYDV